ncbi:MAG: hypothetical protein CM1200mP2_35670 [Planctomycetaceae bacterium]|nr:MAG: hypothetical protein CM1200mP2_35670 [Planctomycetaceae bacterium]
MTTDSIKVDPNRIAEGLSSQPLQSIGGQLFVGRRLAHSSSVIFTRVERNASPQMITHWRTVGGSGLIECQRMSNGLLLCLTKTRGAVSYPRERTGNGGVQVQYPGRIAVAGRIGHAPRLGAILGRTCRGLVRFA